MRAEVLRFLPIGGLFAGVVVGVALDPTAQEINWWPAVAGFAGGVVASFALRRRSRGERGQDG
jgi:membrane associated rhomboid family serine protease